MDLNKAEPTLSKVMHLKHDTKESFESYCNKVLSVNKSEEHKSSLFEDIFKTNQYTCEFCDKSFSRQGHLESHLHFHTGQRPFFCEVCKRTFSLKSTLFSHMSVHTRERPFFCDICMKAFIKKKHLVDHMQSHSGQRPCICKVCNKSFSRKSNLNKHSKKAHS